MNANIPWPSMFMANPSTSQSQWGEASNPSAISSERQSYEGISSENEERSQRETNPKWNPKPEQIRLLESIFNSGVTNPTPKEIERIRDQLQEFGQVRDANVFYWFQNKKARTKRRQRHLQSGETSKSISEKSKTDQSKEIIGVADTTRKSLGNDGETYSSVVPTAQLSFHQDHYHLQMNEGISNDPCSYTDAVAATIARGGIFNEGTGENLMHDCSITVFINNVPFQVPVGPINVKGIFGENAVLLRSTGHPILLNEWGFTMEGLQHGAMYYWI